MITDYKSLDDQDKIFVLRYYNWHRYASNEHKEITITEIRDSIKPFYQSKDITNLDIKRHFTDMEWIDSNVDNSIEIKFYGGIMDFMEELSNDIIEIFISPKFESFLIKSEIPMLFEKKRGIIDTIYRIKSDECNHAASYTKSKILDYIIKNFCLMANLYLAHKGRFVF